LGNAIFQGKEAFEPSLYQRQSPPSGNVIFQGRDKDPETAPAIQWAECRDKMRARIAASSGLFALNREISICAGLRGGPERTRTACQPRSRYRTYIRPRSKPASCLQSLNPNISAATAALPPAIRNKSESAARGLNGNTTAPLVWIVHKFVESDV
jgi:hypothetical protein